MANDMVILFKLLKYIEKECSFAVLAFCRVYNEAGKNILPLSFSEAKDSTMFTDNKEIIYVS